MANNTTPKSSSDSSVSTSGYDASSQSSSKQYGFEAGQVIAGRYTLLEMLGEGGMGEVWVARQEEPVKRKVAIKLIKVGADTKGIVSRFEQERQALAVMDHPNIAKVYDGGLTNDQGSGAAPSPSPHATPGRPYFVMELVQGQALVKFCDAHKLSVSERLELFVPICRAVQHAHQKGIIHRDLKPANILVSMVDGKPVPKVIDFGVAKAMTGKLTEETLSTQLGAFVGTLDYMPPEQAGLSMEDIDTRADIYALGVVLYELLTGLRPFDSKRLRLAALDEMLRIIKEEEPPSLASRLSTDASLPSLAAMRQCEPSRLMSLLKGELDWIVHKCLEKDRTRRYETATGLARDIERFLADEPLEARPASAGYRLGKFYRRHRGAVWGSGIVVAALLVGAVAALWGMIHARDAEMRALEQAEIAKKEKAIAVKERDEKEAARSAEAAARKEAQASEQSAVLEMKRTRAISDFLQFDLLALASVEAQLDESAGYFGRDVKVRDLLDRAAARVSEKFANQPELEAEIRCTIGVTYRKLGELDRAIPHLERAVEICLQKLGPHHPSTMQARNSLGVAYSQKGEHAKSMMLHDSVHESLGKAEVKDSTLLHYQCNRALSYLHGGKEAEGLQLLGTTYKDARQKLGARDDLTVTSGVSYGHALLRAGKPREALSILEETATNCSMSKGEQHPITIIAQVNLGQALQAVGKYKQASQLLETLIPLAERVLGAEHPNTLTAMSVLGKSYEDLNRYGDAEKLLRKVWMVHQSRFGIDHPKAMVTENNLAVVLDKLNKLDEAKAMHEHVYAQRRKQLGEDHSETLLSLNNLAGVLESQGQGDRARSMYETCYQLHSKKKGPTHPNSLRMLTNLANSCQKAGRFEEARKHYEMARKDLLATLGPKNPDTLYAGHFLAETLRSLNQPVQSAQLYAEVLPLFRQVLGDDHADTICTANNLAVVQSQIGQHQEALDHQEWVVTQRTRLLGAMHSETVQAKITQARILRQANRTEEALRLNQSLLAPLVKLRGQEHASVFRLMHETGLCFYQLRRYDEAVKLYQALVDKKHRKLGEQHPDTLSTQVNLGCAQVKLGQALIVQKKTMEAEPLLVQGCQTLSRLLKDPSATQAMRACRADGIQELIKLYSEAEKKEEVQRWRQEAEKK